MIYWQGATHSAIIGELSKDQTQVLFIYLLQMLAALWNKVEPFIAKIVFDAEINRTRKTTVHWNHKRLIFQGQVWVYISIKTLFQNDWSFISLADMPIQSIKISTWDLRSVILLNNPLLADSVT